MSRLDELKEWVSRTPVETDILLPKGAQEPVKDVRYLLGRVNLLEDDLERLLNVVHAYLYAQLQASPDQAEELVFRKNELLMRSRLIEMHDRMRAGVAEDAII